MPRPIEHYDVVNISPDEWLARLVTSEASPVQEGLTYPGFPDEAVQKQFVGSAHESALREAFNFYQFVNSKTKASTYAKCGATRYLDFGSGWGRVGRFFLRDFERGDMVGVDIDAGMVEFCKSADGPGAFFEIANGHPLPFAAGTFKLVTAYSVFTHLPPKLFEAWISEIMRILAPNGLLVLTIESPRFLDFIDNIDAANADSLWHQSLAARKSETAAMRSQLAKFGIAYIPTGGGAMRTPDVYGETITTPKFISSILANKGLVVDYLDDAARFWQAVAVVRRCRAR